MAQDAIRPDLREQIERYDDYTLKLGWKPSQPRKTEACSAKLLQPRDQRAHLVANRCRIPEWVFLNTVSLITFGATRMVAAKAQTSSAPDGIKIAMNRGDNPSRQGQEDSSECVAYCR